MTSSRNKFSGLSIVIILAMTISVISIPVPITIDPLNPCGKNCAICVGYSCKQEACMNNYFMDGDQCTPILEKEIQNCIRYNFDGSACLKCAFNFFVSSGKCVKCHYSCKTCKAAGSNMCLTCLDLKKRTESKAYAEDVQTTVGGSCT